MTICSTIEVSTRLPTAIGPKSGRLVSHTNSCGDDCQTGSIPIAAVTTARRVAYHTSGSPVGRWVRDRHRRVTAFYEHVAVGTGTSDIVLDAMSHWATTGDKTKGAQLYSFKQMIHNFI